MKTIINKTIIILTVLIAVVGCKPDDMEYKDPVVTAVEDLYTPIENQYVALRSAKDAFIQFQWSPSRVQDGQLVSYEVVFYDKKESTTPIYRIASDNTGKEPYARISHVNLNKVASAAGIPVGETGTIYWTTTSWRGLGSAVCATKNALALTRLNGFEVVPDMVYAIGSGTEVGEELSKALTMKKVEDGVFEIYTELDNAGQYYFVDRISGTPVKYFIEESGALAEAKNNETSTISTKGVYRIKLDFTTRSTEITKITNMVIWHCWEQIPVVSLTYTGSGKWEGATDNLSKPNGNGDTRYKIRMSVNTDEGAAQWWWGPTNENEDADPTGSAAYYNMNLYYTPKNQWDPKWKFEPNPWGKKLTVTVSLDGASSYTHVMAYN